MSDLTNVYGTATISHVCPNCHGGNTTYFSTWVDEKTGKLNKAIDTECRHCNHQYTVIRPKKNY